jgi:hypothetical protein
MADKRLFINSVLIHSTSTLLKIYREDCADGAFFNRSTKNKSKGNYQKPINPGRGKFKIDRHFVDNHIWLQENSAHHPQQ